jgi:hypothetical protein
VFFPDAGVGTHLSTTRGELVWWCSPGATGKGHIMSSFNTAGYGQVDFSPKRVFTDVRRVCWDQNLTNLGNRKWTQVIVVSEQEFQSHKLPDGRPRLDYIAPWLEHGPGSAGIFLDGDTFLYEQIQGRPHVFTATGDDAHWRGFTTSDKAARFTHCIRDRGDGTVRITQERGPDTIETAILRGSFPDGRARVIFQDDNYNPQKAESRPSVTAPFTWHWDNIIIA